MNIGDYVYSIDGKFCGTILDMDGDIVYIEQKNGAEVDFLISKLTLEKPISKFDRDAALVAPSLFLMAFPRGQEIYNNLPAFIKNLVEQTYVQYYIAHEPFIPDFDTIDIESKWNIIYKLFGVYPDNAGIFNNKTDAELSIFVDVMIGIQKASF